MGEIEEKEYKVTEDFLKSRLRWKALLFSNKVGMILLKDIKNDWDCIGELLSNLQHCRESLPKNSSIKFGGIQFIVETDNELTKDEVSALEGMGFQYLGATVPFSDEFKWQSTLYLQNPDYWTKDYEEFLLTYHNFLQKKYEERMKV